MAEHLPAHPVFAMLAHDQPSEQLQALEQTRLQEQQWSHESSASVRPASSITAPGNWLAAVVAVDPHELYVWDAARRHVLAIDLHALAAGGFVHRVRPPVIRRVRLFATARAPANAPALATIQTLVCSPPPPPPPPVDVRALVLSECGARLALVGERAIACMNIPRPGTDEEVICPLHFVGAPLFLRSHSLRVLQVRWHPLSASESHLVVLLSDNVLRCVPAVLPFRDVRRAHRCSTYSATEPPGVQHVQCRAPCGHGGNSMVVGVRCAPKRHVGLFRVAAWHGVAKCCGII